MGQIALTGSQWALLLGWIVMEKHHSRFLGDKKNVGEGVPGHFSSLCLLSNSISRSPKGLFHGQGLNRNNVVSTGVLCSL